MTERQCRFQRLIITWLAIVFGIAAAIGGSRNDRLLNRPYADQKHFNLGFGFGMNFPTLLLTHSGSTTTNGESWFMEQSSINPGFSVCGVGAFRLNSFFSLRVTPGISFSSRELKMIEPTTGLTASQNIRSTFVQLPFDLKYSALRFGNLRPYMGGGVIAAFDLGKNRSDMLKLRQSDLYLSLAVGCDFYLPFFKLTPELKFCLGLNDMIEHNRPDLIDNPAAMKYTDALKKAVSRMVILTFYFE